MSNREALRKLSRKYPAPPDVEKILDDLRDDEDMSVAVVCAALLDASLERLIESRFVHKKSNLAGQIFRNRGPLSDFQSKILVASAFDIITPIMAGEMDSLRVIRNAFAHAKIPISFENEIVDREMKALEMRLAFKSAEMPESIKWNSPIRGGSFS